LVAGEAVLRTIDVVVVVVAGTTVVIGTVVAGEKPLGSEGAPGKAVPFCPPWATARGFRGPWPDVNTDWDDPRPIHAIPAISNAAITSARTFDTALGFAVAQSGSSPGRA
jgi:hypothetical protein